jgi:transcriptional regulator with XRE-family HTH domain
MISNPIHDPNREFKILKNAKTTWARALEEIRCDKRITAAELAASSGLTKVQYQGRLRNMKGPSPEDLDRFLQALGSDWQVYLEKLGKLPNRPT